MNEGLWVFVKARQSEPKSPFNPVDPEGSSVLVARVAQTGSDSAISECGEAGVWAFPKRLFFNCLARTT